MTRMSLAALGLVIGFGPLAILADEPVKVEGDLKKMQGTWISKDEMSGEDCEWVFKDNTIKLTVPGRKYEIKIKLDEKKTPEKFIDFEVLETSPNAKGFKAPGIYKFDGDDKVKICFGNESSGRPTDYTADFQNTFAFELAKKKDK